MTPIERHNDTKLLAAVAALVVCGAIGLTLVVGMRDEEPEPHTARSRPVAEKPALPTGSTPGGEPFPSDPKLTGSTVDFETVLQAESVDDVAAQSGPAVEIDPDADPEREGFRAWQAGEFDVAAAYFRAAAEADPDRAYTWYMLGLSRWKSGDLDAAVEAMERSIDRNDASIRSFVNLARIENERGSHDRAIEAAERALVLDDASTMALYQKARGFYNLGRTDEAVELLEQCVEQMADYGHAHNLLGLIRLQREDWPAAIASLEEAARLEPRLAYVHNNLGLALERSGREAEAFLAFQRAVEIGGNPRAEANLVRLELLRPRHDPQPTEAVAEVTAPDPSDGDASAEAAIEAELPQESGTVGEGATD